MKLQNFVIIFIIIIIPIVAIFSLYLNLETKTITKQTEYDGKLIEATKEAVEAFEINTTEWNSKYSTLANSKRQNIMSSINTFTTSLANKLGIGGTSKENILNYVPAIIYIMYDGYYIYSPTYVPETITNEKGVQLFYYENSGSEGAQITASATQNISGEIIAGEPMYVRKSGTAKSGTYNGKTITFTTEISDAEKTYKHVLKTFVPYTTQYYDRNGNGYIVNYTLDNYIRIYGEVQSKEGYIIEDFGGTNTIEIPVDSVSNIKVNGSIVGAEILTENIYVRDNLNEEAHLEEYIYIYNSNNDKRYYDSNVDKFFMLNDSHVKVYLPEVSVGNTLAEYKKLLILPNDTNWDYLELYQLLNGSGDTIWYYKNGENNYIPYESQISGNLGRSYDFSAINYYVDTCSFNHWLDNNNIDTESILEKKRETIINDINNNLNLSVSNYSANSKIDYKIFQLSEEDWDQALSNISMITFFQGMKIGLKTYNNYSIVTSTENNEYVSEDSLYYIGQSDDLYYHRYECIEGNPNTYKAYRNTDFKVQNYVKDDVVEYYYKHNAASGENLQQCFECIVNRNNYEERN